MVSAATPLEVFERFHMKMSLYISSASVRATVRLEDNSPGWQVESSAEAAEDLDLGLGPEAADGRADAPDHRQPRRVLLRRRNHELEKVLDLLVQPATKEVLLIDFVSHFPLLWWLAH